MGSFIGCSNITLNHAGKSDPVTGLIRRLPLVISTVSSFPARSHVAMGACKFLYTKPPTWILSTPGMLLLLGATRVRFDQWEGSEDIDPYQLMVQVIEAEGIDMTFLLTPEAAQLVETWLPRPFPMVKQMVVGE